MSHDRPLIDYLPPVLRDVREYQALTQGEDPEIALLWEGMDAAINDQFVVSATEYGVNRWETILQITPKATFTLEERKFSILTRFAEQLPYTIRMLEKMLAELCGPDGFEIRLDANAYTITVLLAISKRNNFEDVRLMVGRVIPANLIVTISLQFNTWEQSMNLVWANPNNYTWGQEKEDSVTND